MSRLDIRSIRRRQILDAAERIAAQKGWTDTTIADICREADVSTGVVTRYFKSKDEITFAALEDVLEDVTTQIRPVLAKDLSIAESIPRLFHMLCKMATTRRELPLLLLHFTAVAVAQQDIATQLQEFFLYIRQQHLAQIEEALPEEWALQGEDPLIFVNLIHSLALGMTLNKVLLGSDFPIEKLASECATMLLEHFDATTHAKEPLN